MQYGDTSLQIDAPGWGAIKQALMAGSATLAAAEPGFHAGCSQEAAAGFVTHCSPLRKSAVAGFLGHLESSRRAGIPASTTREETMYVPEHFDVKQFDTMLAFVRTHAFGQLISSVDHRLFSSHIPFLVSDDNRSLITHVARVNPQWETIDRQEVLVTFQGPHDYISPSWYESPGVPTWNYQAVHVYGRANTITDPQKLARIVNKLTEKFEASRVDPWSAEYREALLQAIVGVQVEITEIQGKYKLSQNRSETDRQRVIEALKNSGSVELATAMRTES